MLDWCFKLPQMNNVCLNVLYVIDGEVFENIGYTKKIKDREKTV